jgi:ankyrin repeat protein
VSNLSFVCWYVFNLLLGTSIYIEKGIVYVGLSTVCVFSHLQSFSEHTYPQIREELPLIIALNCRLSHFSNGIVVFSGNLDKQTSLGNTALHYCSMFSKPECLKLLLRSKPTVDVGECRQCLQ